MDGGVDDVPGASSFCRAFPGGGETTTFSRLVVTAASSPSVEEVSEVSGIVGRAWGVFDDCFGPGILLALMRAGTTGVGLSKISGIRGAVGGLGGNVFKVRFVGLSAPELVSNDFFRMRGGIR